MCDYSLMSFPNSLARAGDELVAYRFAFGAIGFASALELSADRSPLTLRLRKAWTGLWRTGSTRRSQSVVAVCIPPGARLLVSDISQSLQTEIGVRRTEEVTFTELGASPFQYRDAIRFRNGRQILLQRLEEGQRVRVLSLSLPAFVDSTMDMDDQISRWPLRLPLPVAARVEARRSIAFCS
jgi:hypothetical protein